jgi:16S rRNA (cytosine967-C5)-methyltransferase
MPRAAALDLLETVLAQKRPLDEAIDQHERLAGLEPRDRAFARLLAATTLRQLGQIDAVLGRCLDKPLTGRARPAHDLLRLGACQLLFLKTPPHAAVSTAVDLAQARNLGAYKGLINAVLRRLDREGAALLAGLDAEKLNTPDWLWTSWTKAYGENGGRAIAVAQLAEAPLDITVKAEPERWAESLGAEILPTGSLRLKEARGSIADLAGYDAGAWWIQDAAAALPVRFLGDIAGKTVVDLCAAPGGKTAQLAAAGARVIAVDRSKRRVDRLRTNLDRLGLTAETVAADAQTWRPAEPVDAVLLDAPCTATGTIRRHPDIPRLKEPGDVAKMTGLQSKLLTAAAEMVKPGGTVVYCVCSLQTEEGPGRIDALPTASTPLVLDPISLAEAGAAAEFLDRRGRLRTLPSHWTERGGLDGFFIARFKRR